MQKLQFVFCDALGHHVLMILESSSWAEPALGLDGAERGPTQSNNPLFLLLFDQLCVDLDFYRVANHCLAGLEEVVVDQIEIFAVDGRGPRDSATQVAPRVGDCRRRSVNVERDFARSSVDREIADYLQLAAATNDILGLEFDGWVLFNVEEIRTLEILVPRLNPRIDRVDVNAG